MNMIFSKPVWASHKKNITTEDTEFTEVDVVEAYSLNYDNFLIDKDMYFTSAFSVASVVKRFFRVEMAETKRKSGK